MKKLIFNLLSVIVGMQLSAQNLPNPYASIGKKAPVVASVTNGEYEEFFKKDSLVQIGTTVMNRTTGEVAFFAENDPDKFKEFTEHNEKNFRFLSVDPMTSKLPFASPYTYCLNNPILMFDAGGLYPFTVHIRSYHPNEAFGSFGVGKGFAGDNRGFSMSTAKDVTARINQQFTFDVDKGTVTYDKAKGTWSNESSDFKGNKKTAIPVGEVSEMSKSGNTGTFNSSYEGSNPLVKGSPDIDVKANFIVKEDTKRGILTINMNASGDDFPNTEAFLTDASGKSLFLGVDVREGGNDAAPFILAGGATTPIINSTLSVTLDKKGNFKEVFSGGKQYSIDAWNKKIGSTDAKPTDKK